VEDASGTNGFANGVNTTNEYSFDGNGNLTADLNKNYTSILYNYLNLPKRVGTATAGQYISYIYDAAGAKLAKISTTGTFTYYAGNFVYSGSSLSYIIHEEGHIEPSGAYKYYLKDHPGSVRLVVNTTGTGGTIERQTDYYPFGMTIAEYNGSVVDYGYNGKELQDDLINIKKLDWYDYGARFYDPQIGRFHTQDRFAEKYLDFTPYQYGANNPLRFIDINGDSIFIFVDNHRYLYSNGQIYTYSGLDKKNNPIYSEYTPDKGSYLAGMQSSLTDLQFLTETGSELVSYFSGDNHAYINNCTNGNGIDLDAQSTSNPINIGPELTGAEVPSTSGVQQNPLWIDIGHELAHRQDRLENGANVSQPWITVNGDVKARETEKYATYIENRMKKEFGLPLRTHYIMLLPQKTGYEPSRIIDANGNSLFY
jgi:RHS repeat-associated protein